MKKLFSITHIVRIIHNGIYRLSSRLYCDRDEKSDLSINEGFSTLKHFIKIFKILDKFNRQRFSAPRLEQD